MTTFDAGPIMAGLTGFQRRSVEHVMDRFHGADPRRRFLVADETGLGKSLVARGVIARTIETLQHERGRKQINLVYVCSNTDLATQNLSRLDVTGGKHRAVPSRLSLLAKYSRELQPDLEVDGVAVNLVSFTPGTSFGKGHQSGQVQERALLFLLLSPIVDLTGWNRRAALVLLRGTVGSTTTFDQRISELTAELAGPPDPRISDVFLAKCQKQGLITTFESLLVRLGRRHDVPGDMADEVRGLISDMRGILARVGLSVLNPDLVILDEFQRFPELLDVSTPPGELADQLFSIPVPACCSSPPRPTSRSPTRKSQGTTTTPTSCARCSSWTLPSPRRCLRTWPRTAAPLHRAGRSPSSRRACARRCSG